MDDKNLSGPDVAALVALLPLPVALLARDGRPLATSGSFDAQYGPALLECPELRALLHEEAAHWETIPATVAGIRQRVHVYVTSFRDDVLVLFAQAGSSLESTPKVAELEHRVFELERRVATDRLTGAWNRAHLDRMMAIELSRAARHHQPLSVLMLDIDHFKRVNDTWGHAAGDAVLRELVAIARANVRPGDMLFRWGGEEFFVLLPSTSYRQARVVAENLRAAVAAADFPGVGKATVSVGAAERLPDESAAALFDRVDQALYAAKEAGRDRCVVDERGCSDAWEAGVLRIAWSDAYACGHPVLDEQHRRLFAHANRLLEASLKDGARPEEIRTALARLVEDVERHFADEEAILERAGYDGIVRHRRAHAALLKRAGQLRALAEKGMLTFGTLVDFLAHDVVAKHLIGADRAYFPLFKRAPTRSEAIERA